MVIAILAGCAEPEAAVEIAQMGAVEALVRTSLDLRGVRPSAEEISAVEADAGALEGYVDAFLVDERFEGRVRDLWAEVYLTRITPLYVSAAAYGLDDEAQFARSVGEEPLAVLGYVAANDLPWTEIVEGDFTVADTTLAAIWPIDRPEGEGWLRSSYTDGRPAAGVLATNAMWWRYASTDSNANRKRANAASRILLCNDYLVRPIEFDRNVNLLDDAAVDDALRTQPACVNCHASLDPLASYFFGFWWYDPSNVLEASRYFPEREPRWADYTGVAPAYYGEPGYTLADLGHQVAADSRFPQCAVEQAFELLLRRDVTLEDNDTLVGHRDAFLAGGLKLRALLASVVRDPRYRAGATDEPGYVGRKMATPELLASSVADLTGYDWTYAGYELMREDVVGYRTLAGGLDGYAVTAPAEGPNATLVLVQERLAEAAAEHVVATEPSRLLGDLDLAATPETDRAAMVAAIQGLHLRVFGRRVAADGEEVAANLELWEGLYEVERDPAAAWAGLISALLRDPDFLLY